MADEEPLRAAGPLEHDAELDVIRIARVLVLRDDARRRHVALRYAGDGLAPAC
jgi:hypothetical protein